MRRVAQVSKNPVHNLGSRTEVLDLVCELMDNCIGLTEYSPDDDFAKTYDSVNRGLAGSKIFNSETTRFRYRTFNVGVQQLIGVINNVQLKNMMCAAIHGIKSQLQSSQRNGDWSVVAYEVVTKVAKKSARHQNTREAQDYNIFSGKPSPNRLAMGIIEQEKFEVRCVFYDVLENEEIDNWYERTGLQGTLSNGRIPREMQLGLIKCKRILKENLLEQAYLDSDRDLGKALKTLKADKIVWTKEEAEKALGLSEVQSIEPESMTAKQVTVAGTLHAAGTSWRDIASLVGVDWRTVKHHVEGVSEEKEIKKIEIKSTPAVLA